MRFLSRLLLVALLIGPSAIEACSPPPPQGGTVDGPANSSVPYYEPSYYAFIGKVLKEAKDPKGNPGLSIQVLDAWTNRQSVGDVITVGVEQWMGCGLTSPMGDPFNPSQYPPGTRLRIVSKDSTLYTWDVKFIMLVLGVAP